MCAAALAADVALEEELRDGQVLERRKNLRGIGELEENQLPAKRVCLDG